MQVIHRSGVGASRDTRDGWMAWGAALLLAGAAIACDSAGQGAAEPVASVVIDGGREKAAEAAPAPVADDRSTQTKRAGNPLGELVPPAPGQERLVGVVAEHLPAGGYTYLWVEPEQGPARWVVTMRRDVGPGDRVSVDSLGSRHDFYSRRLDRRFAELVFGVVEIVG